MQRRMFVVAGIVSLMGLAAPAAHAQRVPPPDVVPFEVSRTFGPEGITVVHGQSFDTGLVGACDDEAGCTGFRITEATSDIRAGASEGRITLRGVVCIRSLDSRCSPDGVTPFTGVRIFDRDIDTPEPSVDPVFVHVNFCLWWNSHPDAPLGCDIPALFDDGVEMEDSGNLVELVPQELGLTF